MTQPIEQDIQEGLEQAFVGSDRHDRLDTQHRMVGPVNIPLAVRVAGIISGIETDPDTGKPYIYAANLYYGRWEETESGIRASDPIRDISTSSYAVVTVCADEAWASGDKLPVFNNGNHWEPLTGDAGRHRLFADARRQSLYRISDDYDVSVLGSFYGSTGFSTEIRQYDLNIENKDSAFYLTAPGFSLTSERGLSNTWNELWPDLWSFGLYKQRGISRLNGYSRIDPPGIARGSGYYFSSGGFYFTGANFQTPFAVYFRDKAPYFEDRRAEWRAEWLPGGACHTATVISGYSYLFQDDSGTTGTSGWNMGFLTNAWSGYVRQVSQINAYAWYDRTLSGGEVPGSSTYVYPAPQFTGHVIQPFGVDFIPIIDDTASNILSLPRYEYASGASSGIFGLKVSNGIYSGHNRDIIVMPYRDIIARPYNNAGDHTGQYLKCNFIDMTDRTMIISGTNTHWRHRWVVDGAASPDGQGVYSAGIFYNSGGLMVYNVSADTWTQSNIISFVYDVACSNKWAAALTRSTPYIQYALTAGAPSVFTARPSTQTAFEGYLDSIQRGGYGIDGFYIFADHLSNGVEYYQPGATPDRINIAIDPVHLTGAGDWECTRIISSDDGKKNFLACTGNIYKSGFTDLSGHDVIGSMEQLLELDNVSGVSAGDVNRTIIMKSGLYPVFFLIYIKLLAYSNSTETAFGLSYYRHYDVSGRMGTTDWQPWNYKFHTGAPDTWSDDMEAWHNISNLISYDFIGTALTDRHVFQHNDDFYFLAISGSGASWQSSQLSPPSNWGHMTPYYNKAILRNDILYYPTNYNGYMLSGLLEKYSSGLVSGVFAHLGPCPVDGYFSGVRTSEWDEYAAYTPVGIYKSDSGEISLYDAYLYAYRAVHQS